MTTVNISLPERMKAFIEQQVKNGGYSTVSEYLRALIREDQKRQTQQELEAKLVEGLESGSPIEATDRYWEEKRRQLSERVRRNTRQ